MDCFIFNTNTFNFHQKLNFTSLGILPKIWDMINQQIIVKGKTISINIPGLFTVYFNILELRLSDVYYNTTSTNVNLIESNNTIGFHIDNSSIHFNLTYKLYLDPKLLEDSGKIEYGTDHFKMDLIFGMKPRPDDPKKMIITISENSLYFDTKFTFLNLTNVNNFGNFMMDIAKVFKLPIISLVEGMLFYFLY